MSIIQSVCYPIFDDGRPHEEVCQDLAATGVGAVELWQADDATLRSMAKAAESAGLKLCSFTGHDSIDHGFNDPDHWDRCRKELTHAVDLAAELGIPGVICFPGTRRPGLSDAYGLVLTADGIEPVVDHAERKGVNLNMEVLNSRVDHPHYMGDTVDWCIALCRILSSPRMKLLFDIYHVQIMEGDVIRGLRRAMPWIGHVHTAGNPGRAEIDDNQELHYPGIMKALADGGYRGFVGHEFFPRGKDRLGALSEAVRICQTSP
jgi:hydroxypyruvate isomerase